MKSLWFVMRKDLLSLWVSPLAWVLLVVFLAIQGAVFYSIVLNAVASPDTASLDGPLATYFGQSSLVLLSLMLICPALTMRTFAEERRTGTIETLMTAPVSPLAIVLGKYLAVLLTYVALWLPTLAFPWLLRGSGVVDWGVVASGYLGVVLLGAAYLSIGVLMSSLTRSQLVALLLTLSTLFALFLLGIVRYLVPGGAFAEVAAHLSAMVQLEEMSRGVVDLRRLISSGTLIALPLYYTIKIVDAWRWA